MADRPLLPLIDLNDFSGMFTSNNPEVKQPQQLAIAENCDFQHMYGAITKLKGTTRVLASPMSGPISWVSGYNYPDYNGQVQRQVVMQAGSRLYKVDTQTGATVDLDGSDKRKAGLARTSDAFGQFLLISSQNFQDLADRDPDNEGTGVVYDGTALVPWGVKAPGTDETIRESFDSTGGFVLTDCSVTSTSANAWKNNALRVVKTNMASNNFFTEKTGYSFLVSNTADDRTFVRLFIPREFQTNLRTSDRAISIFVGKDANNYYRFDYRVGDLFAGWNKLDMTFTSVPTGSTGISNGTWLPASEAVGYIKLDVFTKQNTDLMELYWDQFVTLDNGIPALTITGGIILFNFDAVTNWSTTGGVFSAVATASDGAPAVSGSMFTATKTSTATKSLFIYKSATDLGYAFSGNSDTNFVNVYLTAANYGLLANTGRAFSIYVTSDASVTAAPALYEATTAWAGASNWARFDFAQSQLSVGWNTLVMNPAAQAPIAGTPNYGSINSMAFEFVTDVPTSLPVVYLEELGKANAAGAYPVTANSSWTYRVTYVDKFGNESNAGPISQPINNVKGVKKDSINLTAIPISPQPHVVSRNIYRSTASGSDWLYVDTIYDNVTTTFTDTTPDGSLSSTKLPPEDGASSFDHGPPPACGIVKVWKRTVFLAGDPQNPNVMYHSRDNDPFSFPALFAYEFDSRITGVFESYLGLVVTTESAIWRILGNNPDYIVEKVLDGIGAVGPLSVGSARRVGFCTDKDGMRFYDLSDVLKISEAIRDRYDTLDKINMSKMYVCHSRRLNTFISAFPDATGVFSKYYMFQYAFDDVSKGWWSEIIPHESANLNFLCMKECEDYQGILRIYAGGADGMLYEFMSEAALGWVNAAGTLYPIHTKVKFNFLRIPPQAENMQPGFSRSTVRFFEYRLDIPYGQATNWTITLDAADGSAENTIPKTTQVFYESLPAGKNLKRIPCGSSWESGSHFRATLENSDIGVEMSLLGIRVLLEMFADQRPIN